MRPCFFVVVPIYFKRSQISMNAILPVFLDAIRSVIIFLEVISAPVRKDSTL